MRIMIRRRKICLNRKLILKNVHNELIINTIITMIDMVLINVITTIITIAIESSLTSPSWQVALGVPAPLDLPMVCKSRRI